MRRGLVSTLLFIYLALLPIGFNYGWLFQVRNRHASKTELSFLCFTIVSVGLCTWGQEGVCVCVCVCVCVRERKREISMSAYSFSPPSCSSICLFAYVLTVLQLMSTFGVFLLRLSVCMLACALPCMCRTTLPYFPGTAAIGLDWCVTQAGTLKGERPGQTWSC